MTVYSYKSVEIVYNVKHANKYLDNDETKSATLHELWANLNETFGLDKVHKDEKVRLELDGETLSIRPEKGEGYKTGELKYK